MKMRQMLQVSAIAAVLAASSLYVSAQDAPEGRRGGAGRGAFAGLDEKQRELLREAMQKDQEQARGLEEKMRAAQRELVNAALAEKYDEKTVRAKAEAVAKIQTDLTVLRAKALSSVAPSLKPEQREQLANSPMGAAMLSGRAGGGGPRGDAAPGAGGGRRRGQEQ